MLPHSPAPKRVIPALTPRGVGHQFVCYADCCSGVPGAPNEAAFAAVNAIVRRLRPAPEFILFPGDHVLGLTTDAAALREQWRHWSTSEMAWLDRRAIPLYSVPGNHDAYDVMSEGVWREVMGDLPRGGPPGQEGLSYAVRRGDLVIVAVNTLASNLGGDGRCDTVWLEETLTRHADARFKLVMGHHPALPVDGYDHPGQQIMERYSGDQLWSLLARHRVLAYLCSHLLTFDVQVNQGVLQIVTAGAGTVQRAVTEHDYLHCLQLALDEAGLRYQALDETGQAREWLAWPPVLPPAETWTPMPREGDQPVVSRAAADSSAAQIVGWRLTGMTSTNGDGPAQTLVSGWANSPDLPPLWIGLEGLEQRLTVHLRPQPGRSGRAWRGPTLRPRAPFDLQVAIHTGMRAGGILWRRGATGAWSSCRSASPWGAERLAWPAHWSVGHDRHGAGDRPFRGDGLRVAWHAAPAPR